MTFEKFYGCNDEKPLDNLVCDGGMTPIFRTIACVGDSLSSGEFQILDAEGKNAYYDMYEYSWGQFMARTCGSKVYNFSRGGMTARWYLSSFANDNDFWNADYRAQGYIFALGVNDIMIQNHTLGSIDDIKENYEENSETFAGWYGKIIQKYKEISPDAKFFLMTMPREYNDSEASVAKKEAHAKLLYQIAESFENMYVLDFNKYAPVYDEEYKKHFYMRGHLNPQGYLVTAKMVMSYIDYIIRHNPKDFEMLGFVGK